jgi:hypothetical protein
MRYLLCWLPDTDINLLRPALDADGLLDLANRGDPDALANMVRLNWMISDVRRSGIIKPIFVRDDTFDVIVGDTRIMAARMAGINQVPVMAYLQQPQGTVCQTHDDILRLSGFGTDAKIHWTPCETDILRDPPDWIDIGDHRTRHHGHDECLRLAAIEEYLRKTPQWLDRDWLLEPKDWGDIFS